MDFKGNIKDVLYDKKHKVWNITFTTTDEVNESLEEFDNKDLDVKVKVHREKRSLDANSYFWVIVSKIAEKINLGNDEVYKKLLDNYGVYTPIVVKESALNRMLSQWRYTKVLGEIKVGNQKGIQVLCYFGSSTYDSKEMSRLIDGAVSEAKDLGIETVTPDELEKMKKLWGE